MKSEAIGILPAFKLSWPNVVTEEDRDEVAAYLAEDVPLEVAVGKVIVNETDLIKCSTLRLIKARFSNHPTRASALEEWATKLCGLYVYPANVLKAAVELDLNGVEVPTLIDKELIDTSAQHVSQKEEMEKSLLRTSIWKWEYDLKTLWMLQRIGPMGFVDKKVEDYLSDMEGSPSIDEEVQALESGRIRFQQLYTAV